MSQITDQIKDRIDIVGFIKEYVPSLKKAGTNFKAQCPFHNEKTPSFIVSPEKGIWHCFGCSKGGDIFGFVREIEGIEFPDAMKLLARRAGIKLEKQDPQKETQRQRILDILKLSSLWFHQALLSAKSGEAARDYVKERQIKDETCDEWKIGFAPDAWEGVSKYLKSRGFRNDEIALAGLSSKNDSGSFYDRFRNRLMFPISDVHGSVIGFAGRKLNNEDIGGKYINTPETLVYHKGSVLFGLSRAKQFIREKDSAIIVEGNIDCISSFQAGVKNVVASSGTALTEDQVRLLKRYTKNICLAFDPDSAGQEALARGMEIAWREEMSIMVIPLPEGKDPDNLIKQSKGEWESAVSSPSEFMDWVIDRAQKRFDFSSAKGKKEGAKFVLQWIARLPDMIEQTHYLQILSKKINVDEAILRSVITKTSKTNQAKPAISTKSSRNKESIQYMISTRLIALMFTLKEKTELARELFPTEDHFILYNSFDKLYDCHIEEFSEEAQKIAREIVLISEDAKQNIPKEAILKEIDSLIARLKEYNFKIEVEKINRLMREAEEVGDDAMARDYMRQWKELSSNYAKEKIKEN